MQEQEQEQEQEQVEVEVEGMEFKVEERPKL